MAIGMAMNEAVDVIERLSSVEAELIYLAPGPDKPRTYCYQLPPGVPHSNYGLDPRRHRIHDARPIADQFTLDRQGLAFFAHRTEATNLIDDEEIRRTYYPEAAAVIKSVTGADLVMIFDHTVRSARHSGAEDANAYRPPVFKVHVDKTEETGIQLVRDTVPDKAEALLRGRIQVINLWRPIRGPVSDTPLALCDARSVRPEQLIATEMVFPKQTVETFRLTYDPAHRWFYFPDMEPDEVVLLKTFDSATDGRARFTPHSAFVAPDAAPGAPPRESIEVRAIVVTAP
jgi:hypothetical protein